MEIELIRDIVIIASGVIFVIVLLVIAFVALSISSKVKEITSSAKGILTKAEAAAEDLQLITSYAREEIARPLARVAGIVQGLGQGLASFTEILNKWK